MKRRRGGRAARSLTQGQPKRKEDCMRVYKRENAAAKRASIIVEGRVDSTTAAAFGEAAARISRDNIRNVDFDFRRLEYISSSGLRVLITCRKKFADGKVRIIGASETVRNILRMTGFEDSFEMIGAESAEEEYGAEEPASVLPGMSFREMLSCLSEEMPDRGAFYFHGKAYTWRQLDLLSDVFAAELSAAGAGELSHVGICGWNSINWLAAFFAVQKLGGIAVLLSPMLAPAELASFCAMGDVSFLCCGDIPGVAKDPGYMKKFQAAAAGTGRAALRCVLDISSRADLSGRGGEGFVLPREMPDPDAPAVMIFTSGTTGMPKGVLLSAVNLMAIGDASNKLIRITPEDRVCIALPLFHIFSLAAGLMMGIAGGCRIYLADSPKSADLIECIEANRCTIMHGVPTVFLSLVSNPELEAHDLSCLRAGYCGGAPITPEQLMKVKQALPEFKIGVGYGMSEIGIAAASAYDDTDGHLLYTVGKPVFDSVQVRAVEPSSGKALGIGEEGELVFKSHDLMIGYYRLPVDQQPFDADGWLHTGDCGFVDSEGYIHLTGRIKDLIIRSGENISPKEVADALCSHPDIENAAVVGIPSPLRGEEVAAAIVTRSGAEVTDAQLKEFLRDKISSFKIPVAFKRYAALPVLPNGKPDVKAIREELAAASGLE